MIKTEKSNKIRNILKKNLVDSKIIRIFVP